MGALAKPIHSPTTPHSATDAQGASFTSESARNRFPARAASAHPSIKVDLLHADNPTRTRK